MKKLTSKLALIGFVILFVCCTDNYKDGIKQYNEKKYGQAWTTLKKVEKTDKNYDDAQIKIKEIDIIFEQERKEKALQDNIAKAEEARKDSIVKAEQERKDSIARVAKQKEELSSFLAQLNREIESIKTFDGSKYRDEVTSLQIEIALFATWAKLVTEAESHPEKEANSLGGNLKSRVIILQKSEFPKMRKAYAEISRGKLWENNIKVSAKGTGYTTLEFIGAVFANNKNKQDFQNALNEMMSLLRFQRINYKWYEYDDNYTYYTMNSNKDGDLVTL